MEDIPQRTEVEQDICRLICIFPRIKLLIGEGNAYRKILHFKAGQIKTQITKTHHFCSGICKRTPCQSTEMGNFRCKTQRRYMSFSKKHGFLEKFSILLHNHRYKRRYRELFSKCLQGRKKISEEVVNRSITECHKAGKGWSRIYNKIRISLLCATSIRKHLLTRFRQGSGMGIHLCNGNSHGSLSFALYHNKTSMPKSNKKRAVLSTALKKTRNART